MIDPRALDTLVGIVAEAPEDGQVVVDVGSNGFETLMAYEVENGVFALLQELGHRVVVQTVIAGGPDAEETVKGTMALLAATDVPVILWLNEHLGPLEIRSKMGSGRSRRRRSCTRRGTGFSGPSCCRRAPRRPSARTPRRCSASA